MSNAYTSFTYMSNKIRENCTKKSFLFTDNKMNKFAQIDWLFGCIITRPRMMDKEAGFRKMIPSGKWFLCLKGLPPVLKWLLVEYHLTGESVMEYRVNRRTGDKISVIGIGTSYICESSEEEALEALGYAYENGINYADLATARNNTFAYFGKAYEGVRKDMFYQVHFGANYGKGGEYGWTLDLDTVKREVGHMLAALRTDYIDYGFIHCLDELSDWESYQENGILDYLLYLKEEGVVRHIGLSSHTPSTASRILDTGLVDQLMFSINPSYDYQEGEYAKGSGSERMALYMKAEKMGVGISVMKPFSGGQLLDEKASPFKKAFTTHQLIKYALDRPSVLTVLPGMRNKKEVEGVLRYFDIPDEEKDYSEISSLTPAEMVGRCVYCNHCHPCPVGINIALVNKYYDLAREGDDMAREHYMKLDVKADACISCGHCTRRCPFKVDGGRRMEEIAAYFSI